MLKDNVFHLVFVAAIAVVQAGYLSSASAEPGPRSLLSRAKSSPGTSAAAPAAAAQLPGLREEMSPFKRARKLAASNPALAGASLMGQAKSTTPALTFREKLESRRLRSGQPATAASTVRLNTAGHAPLSFAEKLQARRATRLQQPQGVSNVDQRKCPVARRFENRGLLPECR